MKKVYVIIMVLCFLGMAIIAAAADPAPTHAARTRAGAKDISTMGSSISPRSRRRR